jgi:hypothetical protein
MSSNAMVLPPHSRRVEAWIYTVLNPLIDAMQRETQLLQQGNLTWRFHSKRSEFIRPTLEYIVSAYLPNLDDFLAEHPTFRDRFDEHDDALSEAEGRARTVFEILLSSPLFQRQVKEFADRYESQFASSQPHYPSLLLMKDDLPKYVAEYLINRVDALPNHYTVHKFWREFAREFELSSHEFGQPKQRQSSAALGEAVDTLSEISMRLRRELESHRLFLCRKYDIPAAPVALS